MSSEGSFCPLHETPSTDLSIYHDAFHLGFPSTILQLLNLNACSSRDPDLYFISPIGLTLFCSVEIAIHYAL
jgi:hypothetical protein